MKIKKASIDRTKELDNTLSLLSESATFVPAEDLFLKMTTYRVLKKLPGDHIHEPNFVVEQLLDDGFIIHREKRIPPPPGSKNSNMEIRLNSKGRRFIESGGYSASMNSQRWRTRANQARTTIIAINELFIMWIGWRQAVAAENDNLSASALTLLTQKITTLETTMDSLENQLLSQAQRHDDLIKSLTPDTTRKKK